MVVQTMSTDCGRTRPFGSCWRRMRFTSSVNRVCGYGKQQGGGIHSLPCSFLNDVDRVAKLNYQPTDGESVASHTRACLTLVVIR